MRKNKPSRPNLNIDIPDAAVAVPPLPAVVHNPQADTQSSQTGASTAARAAVARQPTTRSDRSRSHSRSTSNPTNVAAGSRTLSHSRSRSDSTEASTGDRPAPKKDDYTFRHLLGDRTPPEKLTRPLPRSLRSEGSKRKVEKEKEPTLIDDWVAQYNRHTGPVGSVEILNRIVKESERQKAEAKAAARAEKEKNGESSKNAPPPTFPAHPAIAVPVAAKAENEKKGEASKKVLPPSRPSRPEIAVPPAVKTTAGRSVVRDSEANDTMTDPSQTDMPPTLQSVPEEIISPILTNAPAIPPAVLPPKKTAVSERRSDERSRLQDHADLVAALQSYPEGPVTVESAPPADATTLLEELRRADTSTNTTKSREKKGNSFTKGKGEAHPLKKLLREQEADRPTAIEERFEDIKNSFRERREKRKEEKREREKEKREHERELLKARISAPVPMDPNLVETPSPPPRKVIRPIKSMKQGKESVALDEGELEKLQIADKNTTTVRRGTTFGDVIRAANGDKDKGKSRLPFSRKPSVASRIPSIHDTISSPVNRASEDPAPWERPTTPLLPDLPESRPALQHSSASTSRFFSDSFSKATNFKTPKWLKHKGSDSTVSSFECEGVPEDVQAHYPEHFAANRERAGSLAESPIPVQPPIPQLPYATKEEFEHTYEDIEEESASPASSPSSPCPPARPMPFNYRAAHPFRRENSTRGGPSRPGASRMHTEPVRKPSAREDSGFGSIERQDTNTNNNGSDQSLVSVWNSREMDLRAQAASHASSMYSRDTEGQEYVPVRQGWNRDCKKDSTFYQFYDEVLKTPKGT